MSQVFQNLLTGISEFVTYGFLILLALSVVITGVLFGLSLVIG